MKSLIQGQGEIGVISPTQMVRRLLATGSKLMSIANDIGASPEVVKALASNSDPSDIFNPTHQALFKLYLKQKVKSILSRSPFMGGDRASELLEVDRDTYQEIYNSLIASGEVTFEMVTPDWEGATATDPLRKHAVK